jgi:D-beta-D-heptose 7-phosphate kinase/D-beta-D-heptose 1-phosphate adenosyltransferase
MNILVIGEVCTDKFIYCKIDRLSPEAPVPILTPVITTQNPGMAGNVISNLKALEPSYYTMLLGQNEVITKTRYIEEKSNHMFLRVDEGEDKITQFKWTQDIDVILGQSDIVIVSDYNKGFLTNGDLKEIARKSKLSILDSKRKLTDDIIKGFTFVKLNESEFKNNPDLTTDNIIVTLGAKGASYKGKLIPQTNPQETIDVSGAGDTFTATFILNYFNHQDVDQAIIEANLKAGIVVTKRGVVTP